jgi:hypothetical protein
MVWRAGYRKVGANRAAEIWIGQRPPPPFIIDGGITLLEDKQSQGPYLYICDPANLALGHLSEGCFALSISMRTDIGAATPLHRGYGGRAPLPLPPTYIAQLS